MGVIYDPGEIIGFPALSHVHVFFHIYQWIIARSQDVKKYTFHARLPFSGDISATILNQILNQPCW